MENLYSSPNIIWVIKSRIRWVRHVAYIREQRCASRVLVGKPEEKRPLGIPRYRWEENINVDIKEVAIRKWTGLMWLRRGTSGGLL